MSITQTIRIPLSSDSHNSTATAHLVLQTNNIGEVELSLTDEGREVAVKQEDLFKAIAALSL